MNIFHNIFILPRSQSLVSPLIPNEIHQGRPHQLTSLIVHYHYKISCCKNISMAENFPVLFPQNQKEHSTQVCASKVEDSKFTAKADQKRLVVLDTAPVAKHDSGTGDVP